MFNKEAQDVTHVLAYFSSSKLHKMLRQFEGFDWLDQFERPPRRVVDKTNPFEAMTDREFLERFRLNKESTRHIIQQIHQNLPRTRNSRGSIFIDAKSPHACNSLSKIRSFTFLYPPQGILSHFTCSTCVARVVRAIAGLWVEWIKMPFVNDVNGVMQTFHARAGMPAVIGCIDCTHIAISRPPSSSLPRAGRWPLKGSFLGDSGYSCRRYLLTPILNPRTVQKRRYNVAHITTRNTNERAFSVLKRRLCCLGKRMQTELNNTKAMVVAASVPHNVAIQ
ncbi:putative nuclease HARBI1 [Penaeus vannamei]|uniref:putative nuclease HARBI1 n=1 Tax=Penaeus vannamei TaxID=6689 RepID=UPI00387F82A4